MSPRTFAFPAVVWASTLGGCSGDGFSEPPETTLGPADSSYTGTLTPPSGEPVPIRMTLTLNRQSVRARYWDVGTAVVEPCPPPVLTANVDVTIEGGTTLSGVAAGGVTTEGGALFISAPAEATVTSTLMPSFSQPPLRAPDLSIEMSHLDGVWSGQWQWFAQVDCSGAEMCTGLEIVSLGNVLMERN